MKGFGRVLVMLILSTVLAVSGLHAQDWSAAQKEVWKNVETYWALDATGNLDGFMSYFHDNYIGWELSQPLPSGKATARKFIDHAYKTSSTVLYDIKPVAINIFGNVAIVDYYYTTIMKDNAGKENERSGRWVDIVMKQGDKWVLIGDHGGRTSKD